MNPDLQKSVSYVKLPRPGVRSFESNIRTFVSETNKPR
jgi:hypothetical protein